MTMEELVTDLVKNLGATGGVIAILALFLWKVVRPMAEKVIGAHGTLVETLTKNNDRQTQCIESLEHSAKSSVQQQTEVVKQLVEMDKRDERIGRKVDEIHSRVVEQK